MPGAAFVAAIAAAAEAANHHPDLKLTYGAVDVSLCTHEDGLWVTQKRHRPGAEDQRDRTRQRAHA